ncbi:uncharacterized protein BDR25DRAFT_285558 [Lindgomyces ingoldianus]|uniref:Uncharacterized protein n=1 Tax=Lindgomyces ingoldianus TaxID=673940 RepID=A0ACB6QX31_9PLEO|nr:uncharacterized protein BDR25DRAFT_285558 [Lindgomyces ingoldianus]KAF2471128.1 hypothetical protein BDR25DRAFT_285558 [Lindgomyces ingoldianus]
MANPRPVYLSNTSSNLGAPKIPSFRNLTIDRKPLENFKKAAEKEGKRIEEEKRASGDLGYNLPAYNNRLPLHVFEWDQDGLNGTEISNIRCVGDLLALDTPSVRVIFAPQSIAHPQSVKGMTELFEYFAIPSAFIAESLQQVSQSFCSRKDENGNQYTWFHFLAKDIAISDDDKPRRIVHPSENKDQPEKKTLALHPVHQQRAANQAVDARRRAQEQSQANFTWIKAGFLLKVGHRNGRSLPQSPQRRGTTTTNESSTTLAQEEKCVTLFCFGAPSSLGDRFRELASSASSEDLIQDPYALLEIVLEEMYKVMDRVGWLVSDIFGEIETKTLDIARTPGKAGEEVKFPGLHNLAKHTIYLRENCESALSTVENLRTHHMRLMRSDPSIWETSTQNALEYRKTMFQSTQRRLESLDKRMANILQLSFHLVTQTDSRVMMSENQSMKTIAVMTLIFMPLGTVASIFGTQLIKLKDDAPFHMQVSQDFWLLWVIAVPLTIVVMTVWRVWYRDAKAQLIDENPVRPKGERGYMGWKTVRNTFSGSKNTKKSADDKV